MSQQNEKEEHPVVHVSCRRGHDQVTAGQSCGSKRAYNMSRPGAHAATFKCVECNFSWSIATGGAFNF